MAGSSTRSCWPTSSTSDGSTSRRSRSTRPNSSSGSRRRRDVRAAEHPRRRGRGRRPARRGRQDRTRQIVVNLVENAVKYSPDGGRIELGVRESDGMIGFRVLDEGMGPANEHPRIFEKFYRLDPDMTRGIGGTGLGLYICSELVERMGGHIWVESRAEGKRVPVRAAECRHAEAGREAARGAGQARLRIGSRRAPARRRARARPRPARSRRGGPGVPARCRRREVRADRAILWTSVARPGTCGREVSADRRFRGMPGARVRVPTGRVGAIVGIRASSRSRRDAATVPLPPASRAQPCRPVPHRAAARRAGSRPVRVHGRRRRHPRSPDGAAGLQRLEVYGRMAAEGNDFNINLGDTIYSDSEVGACRRH